MAGDDTSFRKLAAIMFTDMVGYSAMMQQNEALTLELLEDQRQLLRPIFPKHQGREVKSTGDGFLVEFPSALAATLCGVELQRAIIQRNATSPPERRFQIRIGVHVGDVEFREADMFGDGVNIAARIEPLAEAGGICLSGAVADQIRNKVQTPLVKLDSPRMKNIQSPMDVYRVVMPWDVQPAAPHAAPGFSPPKQLNVTLLLGAAVSLLIILCVGLIFQKAGSPQKEQTASASAKPPTPTPPAVEATKATGSRAQVVFKEAFDDLDEHGWPKGWEATLMPGFNISTKTEQGNRYLVLDSKRDDETVAIARTIKLDPRWKRLKITSRYKTENLVTSPKGGGAVINWVWKDSIVNQIQWLGAAGEVRKPGPAPDMNWTAQEIVHKVPEEASYAMIVISLGHASGTLSFDDLVVTVEEEGERDYSLNWKRLFNGRNLDGWTVLNEHRKYWGVEDGILTCQGREGSEFSVGLWWPDPVGDFEIQFSYKLEGAQGGDKHNAVFFYRSNKQDGYRLALIREGVLGLLSERGMLNSPPDNSVVTVAEGKDVRNVKSRQMDPAEVSRLNKVNGWNEIRVWVEGNLHQVTFNGFLIMQTTDENVMRRTSQGEMGFSLWNGELPFAKLYLKNIRLRNITKPAAK